MQTAVGGGWPVAVELQTQNTTTIWRLDRLSIHKGVEIKKRDGNTL